jgi:nitroreductase
MLTANGRSTERPIDPMFLERWSPRAFTAGTIFESELMTMFDAARWAPSSYNSQPWRFLYARRDTPHWPQFLGLLNANNQGWVKNASAIVFLVSKLKMLPPNQQAEVPSYTHALDCGAAWGYLALQAHRMGWATHAMIGLDYQRATTELKVPADHRVEIAIAIGKRADRSVLPEALQARETPNSRNPLSATVREGPFPG